MPNGLLVSQAVYLEDMAFVRQTDHGTIKGCYLDQLGTFLALFLRDSG